MLDRRFALTGAALALVAAFSYLVVSPPRNPEIAPIAEPISGIEREREPEPSSKPDYMYLIRELDGRVAVYPAGDSEPEIVLDVLVKFLPDHDRSQMKEGIPVKDYNHLVSLIEDYTS